MIFSDMLFIKCMSFCSYAIHNMPSDTTRLLPPPPPWNARHACTMTLTLHLIMSLHDHEREPIKPVHCACKHDVCSVIYDLNNTPSDIAFERQKVREKILWRTKSSQTLVTWPPWGGRKGMSSNNPPIVPSPIRAILIFKKLPSSENKTPNFQNYNQIKPPLQFSTLEPCFTLPDMAYTMKLLALTTPLHTLCMPYLDQRAQHS